MPTTKMYAVVLTEAGAAQLSPVVIHMLKTSGKVPEVHPEGQYFHLVIREKGPTGEDINFEIQIPHFMILVVLYAANLKTIGFA
jgi:hypothetical protein